MRLIQLPQASHYNQDQEPNVDLVLGHVHRDLVVTAREYAELVMTTVQVFQTVVSLRYPTNGHMSRCWKLPN